MKNGMHVDRWGNKRWYLNGWLHREDGPAYEGASSYKAWYKNGVLHRLDGPAIEDADGYKEWYLNDQRYYSFDDWLEKLNIPDDDKLILKLKWA